MQPILTENSVLIITWISLIGGNTLEKRKVDPLPLLLHAAELYRQQPETSLMVGDSISDVNAARAARFQSVCVNYSYNHG